MEALLSKLLGPYEVYIWAACAVGVLAWGVWAVHHEREIGAEQIVALDTKIAELAAQHNADVQALAESQSAQLGEVYVQAVKVGPTDSPHVVCYQPPVRGQVSGASGNSGSDHGAAVVPAASPQDIGSPLDAVGFDADQQVIALQKEVKTLVAEMQPAVVK